MFRRSYFRPLYSTYDIRLSQVLSNTNLPVDRRWQAWPRVKGRNWVGRNKEGGLQSAVVRETSGAGRTSRHEQLTPTAHQATSANLQWDLWCRAGIVPSLSDTPCVSDCEIRMSSGSPYHRKPCPAIESREHLKTEDAVVADRRVPAFTLYSCEKCLRTCISQFGVRRLVAAFRSLE